MQQYYIKHRKEDHKGIGGKEYEQDWIQRGTLDKAVN